MFDEIIVVKVEEGVFIVVVGNKKDLNVWEVREEDIMELIRLNSLDKI